MTNDPGTTEMLRSALEEKTREATRLLNLLTKAESDRDAAQARSMSRANESDVLRMERTRAVAEHDAARAGEKAAQTDRAAWQAEAQKSKAELEVAQRDCQSLRLELEEARERIAQLEGAIEKAPHAAVCAQTYTSASKWYGPCDCYRAALRTPVAPDTVADKVDAILAPMGVFVDREKMRKTPRSPPPRYDDIYAAGVAAMDESDSGAPNASLPEPSSAGEPNPFVMAGGVYMGADGQWKKPGAGEPERPVCKTCGDTGRMLADADPIFENRMPCPDCGCQGVRPDTKERP